MSRVFFSDLHLESIRSPAYQKFQEVLEQATRDRDEVFILGDLVEVWVGDDDDSEFADQLRLDLTRATQHIPVHLMHGNRDFLYRETLESVTGVRLLQDPHTLIREDLTAPVFLTHGDAYCTSDSAYMQARRLFRSAEWQDNILKSTLEERRLLAQNLRDQSKQANELKADNITDVVEQELGRAAQDAECHHIIHGHTHRPAIHQLPNNAIRYVLGAWDQCGWILRNSGDHFHLERFKL